MCNIKSITKPQPSLCEVKIQNKMNCVRSFTILHVKFKKKSYKKGVNLSEKHLILLAFPGK